MQNLHIVCNTYNNFIYHDKCMIISLPSKFKHKENYFKFEDMLLTGYFMLNR